MADNPQLGAPVTALPSGRRPERRPLMGRLVVIEPLDVARHAGDLYASFASSDPEGRLWAYVSGGPFTRFEAFRDWLIAAQSGDDPMAFAIVPKESGRAAGMASYMRMKPQDGVGEIGYIWFAPALQRTRAATEALYVMMAHLLDDLRYRRLEWKCNALNAASRRAAERLGFAFEGIFRNHMIMKGRNRDTAWYAILAEDWPPLARAFETWLGDDNFTADGRQKQRLSDLTRAARGSCCA